MLTVFVNRQGTVMFTYPDVELHQADKVRHNGKIYLVVSKNFDVNGGFYEILLHESAEE